MMGVWMDGWLAGWPDANPRRPERGSGSRSNVARLMEAMMFMRIRSG